MARSRWVVLAGVLIAVGCAPKNPGRRAHDLSTVQHDAEAEQHELAAAVHGAEYDPAASATLEQCEGRGGITVNAGPCWTVVTNPTQEHLKAASEQRRMAAEHRAASAELRAAEAQACAGIAEDDRDISPFDHVEDISDVVPLTETRGAGKTTATFTAGAVVTFRAVPGLTAEYLQRTVDCHLARNAALGHVVPEMPACPLVPVGAEALVSSTGTGFAVTIRSDDPDAAAEILARAQRLVAVSPVVWP